MKTSMRDENVVKGEEAMEMFKLVKQAGMLPAKMDDLVPLSFIGQAAVAFYRAKIKVMTQLGMTEAQRKATLRDGQDAGEMLLDIEARIGELYDNLPSLEGHVGKGKTQMAVTAAGKTKAIEDAGLDARRARKSSEIHRNPDVVAKIKAQARENEDIPTKTAVLNAIQYEKEKERQAKAAPIKEANRKAYPPEQMLYISALDQCIHVLPQKPPRDWHEAALREATAKAIIIRKRLEVFAWTQGKQIKG